MNASELYRAGRLAEAIDAQIQAVKTDPADQAKRVFLFELVVFAGDLDRARRQIDAVNYVEPDLMAAVVLYRSLVDAETARRRLFKEGLQPRFLAEPSEHVKLRLEAVNLLRGNRASEAAACLEKAAGITPTVAGVLNDKPFQSLRDCDDLFAGVLEVLSQGNYYWVPFEQIDILTMNVPSTPRDLCWPPAHLGIKSGPEGDVFLPALYIGSHESPDDQLKLGRVTDWKAEEGSPVLGVGLRTFLFDDDPITLLEWRQLEIQEASGG
jgi:type VI secretion system protein ImpE